LFDYVSDIWNFADVFKVISSWYLIFLVIFKDGARGQHGLVCFLNFLLFFKIFLGLNQYKSMRVIFALVKAVVVDIIPFSIFLLLSMALIATTNYHLQMHSEKNSEGLYDT